MNIIHPATGEKAVTLEDAKAALWEAHKAHQIVAQEVNEACKRQTAALNELNKAQRVFDAAVGDIRAQAPQGSDWGPNPYRAEGESRP